MIELLVVIAIIGVLAAAVLAAINPVEQINKGRDTRLRSDSAELTNAIERYFAVHEFWPWNGACADVATAPCTYDCTTNAGAANCGTDGTDVAYYWDGVDSLASWPPNGLVADSWIWLLDETQEVKPNFVSRLQSEETEYFLAKEDTEGVVYVCFNPSSRQFRAEALERCRAEGESGGSGTEDTLPDSYQATDICVCNDIECAGGVVNMICVP